MYTEKGNETKRYKDSMYNIKKWRIENLQPSTV